MRKVTMVALVTCLLAVFVVGGFSVSFAGPKQLKPLPTKIKIPRKPIPIPPQKPCDGPDPAVTSLRVTRSIIVRNGLKIGVLRITSTLKNVGARNYISRRNQQAFVIQAKNPAVSGPRAYETLAKREFPRLIKGASITLTATYEIPRLIEWGHRERRYGECQAERVILAYVSYDPDILMDGNPQNDDCNGTGPAQVNNQRRYTVRYMVECPW